jgi:CubicO group peptidase (beta-lactamase class C family)
MPVLFRRVLLAVTATTLLIWTSVPFAAATQSQEARVDEVFARWTPQTPGCAVGVGLDGKAVLTKAYGMADLEHAVPNTADTIFEAGSVSKQFTAAAVLVLAEEGKLSLDDPVRKYVPELPDYGAPLTIRHMLTHTSGLRDWGSLAGVAGWPRGDRVHTHAHVVDILSRQTALNFTPGTRWSYSNSGYNLAAVIVSRVSGMSFAEVSRARVFEPLGMTSTSWRDDYTRIVPRRAIAYSGGRGAGAAYRLDMPFENVHGNGGLLTTVGDLLTWNEHFDRPAPADAARVRTQQEPAVLANGRTLEYAYGLYVRPYKGVNEVSHSGSTAGYRAFLTRFPDQRVSVAVLCNAGNANATQYAHAVSDIYLGNRISTDGARPAAIPETRGPTAGLERDATYKPSATELSAFTGVYTSTEVETTLTVEVRDGQLVITARPDRVLRLTPHSQDRFEAQGLGLVTFHRTVGAVTEFSVTQDRVWDLRFRKP